MRTNHKLKAGRIWLADNGFARGLLELFSFTGPSSDSSTEPAAQAGKKAHHGIRISSKAGGLLVAGEEPASAACKTGPLLPLLQLLLLHLSAADTGDRL